MASSAVDNLESEHLRKLKREASLAAPTGYAAGPKCEVCGDWETIITRVPPLMVLGINALCGIGEEWECRRCGHIWEKEKRHSTDSATPVA